MAHFINVNIVFTAAWFPSVRKSTKPEKPHVGQRIEKVSFDKGL